MSLIQEHFACSLVNSKAYYSSTFKFGLELEYLCSFLHMYLGSQSNLLQSKLAVDLQIIHKFTELMFLIQSGNISLCIGAFSIPKKFWFIRNI